MSFFYSTTREDDRAELYGVTLAMRCCTAGPGRCSTLCLGGSQPEMSRKIGVWTLRTHPYPDPRLRIKWGQEILNLLIPTLCSTMG